MTVGPIPRFIVDGLYLGAIEHAPPLRPLVRKIAQYGTFAFSRARRAMIVRNAALALGPGSSPSDHFRCALRMNGFAQRVITDVVAARHAKPEDLRRLVCRFDGAADYFAARRQRRGIVLASIHMGSFEVALATLGILERRIHVLYHPDPMPRFERARSELHARLGVIEHRVSDGVAAWGALLDALRADEAVVVHADRTMPGQNGARMPFLGLPDADLPPGPLRLAATAGSPIVPTFCAWTAKGMHVWCDGSIDVPAARLTAGDVAAHPAQAALVAAMERAIRRYPDQWMAFGDLGVDPARAAAAGPSVASREHAGARP